MKYFTKFLVINLLLLVVFAGCRQEAVIEVCNPKDKSACVTIVDDARKNKRFIYFNSQVQLDSNYIILDISAIDIESDGVFVKWDKDKNIYVSSPQAKIITTRLSNRKYHYLKVLPINREGMPDVLGFHNNGFEVNMFYKSIFPID